MNKLFLFVGFLPFFACSSDNGINPNPTMEEYITSNNLTTQTDPSGIQYIISTIGNGNHPSSSANVTTKYSGKLTNETVFDATAPGATYTVALDVPNLIQGWKIALPLLSKGGKGTFFIPYELAYGETGNSEIPPRADLIFEIELIDF